MPGAKPADKKRDESIDRVINDILANLDDIDDIIADNPHFKNLSTYMVNTAPIDKAGEDLAVRSFAKIQRKAKETSDKIRAFNRRVTGIAKKDQGEYKKDLKHKTKDSIKTLRRLEKDLETTISKQKLISPDKQYAYFGGTATPSDAIKKSIPEPANVQNVYESVKKIIKELEGEKSKD